MVVLAIIIALSLLYLLGPSPSKPIVNTILPSVPSDLHLLQSQIADAESRIALLKPDNQARPALGPVDNVVQDKRRGQGGLDELPAQPSHPDAPRFIETPAYPAHGN